MGDNGRCRGCVNLSYLIYAPEQLGCSDLIADSDAAGHISFTNHNHNTMASSDSKTDTSDKNASESLAPSSRFPIQKVTALARLKSFGETFVSSRKSTPIVFPPPSWELDDEELGAGVSKPPALTEPNYIEPPAVEQPEPFSFANKLRALIEALPLPGASTIGSSFSAQFNPKSDTDHVQDPSTSPVPPGMDPGLLRMLSSEDVMNGDQGTSSGKHIKENPSVWSILAGLKLSGGKEGASPSTPSIVEEEENGLMMYAPLEPKSDSQLQLASSETMLEYVDDSGNTVPQTGTAQPSKNAPVPSPEGTHIVEKHVWVPSTTDLSLLTTWWGYRLYLPPPVMTKLNSSSLKATARAAMITAALKWLLDKVPILLVPPQLRPAMKMLKTLTPLASYVGVFIAWSWDRVRTLDKGISILECYYNLFS